LLYLNLQTLDQPPPTVLFLFFTFLVYDDPEDLYNALVDEDVDGIFMERLQAYYYYSGKTEDENLRIFDVIHAEITYKMALKRSTTCKFLEQNFCFRRRIEHPLIDTFVKQYTVPLKVIYFVFLSVFVLSQLVRTVSKVKVEVVRYNYTGLKQNSLPKFDKLVQLLNT